MFGESPIDLRDFFYFAPACAGRHDKWPHCLRRRLCGVLPRAFPDNDLIHIAVCTAKPVSQKRANTRQSINVRISCQIFLCIKKRYKLFLPRAHHVHNLCTKFYKIFENKITKRKRGGPCGTAPFGSVLKLSVQCLGNATRCTNCRMEAQVEGC